MNYVLDHRGLRIHRYFANTTQYMGIAAIITAFMLVNVETAGTKLASSWDIPVGIFSDLGYLFVWLVSKDVILQNY